MFDARRVEYDIIKHLSSFCQYFVFLTPKKVKNALFYSKSARPSATSYLVIIATDSHQSFAQMCLGNMPTATENGRC